MDIGYTAILSLITGQMCIFSYLWFLSSTCHPPPASPQRMRKKDGKVIIEGAHRIMSKHHPDSHTHLLRFDSLSILVFSRSIFFYHLVDGFHQDNGRDHSNTNFGDQGPAEREKRQMGGTERQEKASVRKLKCMKSHVKL